MIERGVNWVVTRKKWALAAFFLVAVLIAAFAPAIFGARTLLLASQGAPSIVYSGAYAPDSKLGLQLGRTSDPGAPAWQSEPWLALIADQFWGEFTAPLWNPYNSFGTPLAAAMQPQPFFPLALLLSLHLTGWTYSIFIVARLFVGGMLMYGFARQFLTALPSAFAAVTFMLSGYFIIHINMPHLSVEVLAPGVLLAFELLLRKGSWHAVAGAAAMIFLGMAGGMPESLFLILAFGCLYFVCRILFAAELRARAGALLVKFVAAVILGFALSAFILFPFIEFLGLAHDVHQPSNNGGAKVGLGADQDYRLTIQYLLPLISGPILSSIFSNFSGFSGLRGYWGIIPFFFAVIAFLALSFRGMSPETKLRRFLTIFFATTAALMILKRFGNILVNWVGHLPLSELIVYPKYLEPLIGLCIAMLAALGLAALIERRVTAVQTMTAGGVTLGAILVLSLFFVTEVLSLTRWFYFAFFFISLLCGVAIVLGAVLLTREIERARAARRIWLLRGVVGFASLELLFNFIVPAFYLFASLPPAERNPYAGAPYVDFIRAHNTDHSRIFGREHLLFPNWSAVFKLADVRGLDAMTYLRYRAFMRNFLLAPGDEGIASGDLADRYTGSDYTYAFDTDVEQRFLALSSVRYLISDSEYGLPSKILDGIVSQNRGKTTGPFGPQVFRVGDPATTTLRGLLQYPPSARVSFKTRIDEREPVFDALAVISGAAYQKSDGVGFRLEIRVDGKIETLFQAVLNPRDVPADRSGRPVRVDLSQYAGRDIELLFSTDPGPDGNTFGDWGGWARLRFTSRQETSTPALFRDIYDKEVRVYEVPGVLPRAALFRAIEVRPDDEVLARLKDPAFDPNAKAIVSRESLSAADLDTARSLSVPTGVPPAKATITQYRSRHVTIAAETAATSLLVLNDTNFVGWNAYVNGQKAPMVTANYLFRGVFLAPGKSTVEFVYEPRSFQAGLGIALAALAVLLGLMWNERRKTPLRR